MKGILVLTYSLDNRGDESLYVHLYRCIRRDIENGTIAAGQRLPSKRALAQNLGVSVITVEGAYAQLQAEGYVQAVPRRGYYARLLAVDGRDGGGGPVRRAAILGPGTSGRAASGPVAAAARVVDVRLAGASPLQALGEAAADADGEEADADEAPRPTMLADFTGALPATGVFPYALWARTVREVLTCESEQTLLREAASAGSPRLRSALASYLRESRGMAVDPAQIVVGAGAQVLYNLIVQLLGRDRTYAVENPGYPRLCSIYRANNAALAFVGLDGQGIAMDGLRASGASVAHVMPSHQYPTGLVTSIGRRYELLAWANEGADPRRYIIEDDYDCEFRLAGRPIPSLQSVDPMERVVYANTFAKSLGPAFRMGYMVLPPYLAVQFEERLGFYSCTVSAIEQLALARFIEAGDYERHVGRARTRYRRVRDVLLAALRGSAFGDRLALEGADAGLHVLMGVRGVAASERELARRAGALGVGLAPLSDFAVEGAQGAPGPFDPACRWFVMSYAGVDPAAIPAAVAVLERVFCG